MNSPENLPKRNLRDTWQSQTKTNKLSVRFGEEFYKYLCVCIVRKAFRERENKEFTDSKESKANRMNWISDILKNIFVHWQWHDEGNVIELKRNEQKLKLNFGYNSIWNIEFRIWQQCTRCWFRWRIGKKKCRSFDASTHHRSLRIQQTEQVNFWLQFSICNINIYILWYHLSVNVVGHIRRRSAANFLSLFWFYVCLLCCRCVSLPAHHRACLHRFRSSCQCVAKR